MNRRHALLSTVSVIPALLMPAVAAAQSITLDPPPVRQPLDEHGVDLSSGEIAVPSSTLGIGGEGGLVHSRYRVGNGWRHNYLISAKIKSGQNTATLDVGGARRTFTLTGGIYVSDQDPAEFITPNFATGTHVFTARDGTQIVLKTQYVTAGQSYYGEADALGEEIVSPDDRKVRLHYRNDYYETLLPNGSFYSIFVVRLQSVTSNTGYQLHFQYASNDPSGNVDNWYRIGRVTAINNAVEYCDPMAATCSLTTVWPYLDYAESMSGTDKLETVTDVLGRQARFRSDASLRLTGVKRPGEATDGMSIVYDTNDRVSWITLQNSYTRTYSWTENAGLLTSVSTDALGRQRTVVTDMEEGLILSSANALGQTTQYTYDSEGRLAETTAPEGNRTTITRDARGRVTEVRQKAKTGSGLADIVTSATYPALTSGTACANAVTCDSPLTTTDARGKVTNYTYDPVHGGPTQVQLPPDAAGIRPRTDLAYTTKFAKVKNAAGTLVQLTDGLVVPASARRCRTANTCTGSADEELVSVAYNNALAPNLQPVSVTRQTGDGAIGQTSSFTYNHLGSVLTVDGPLAGTGDTSRNHYDAAGQLVGSVGPDPDGAGSLPHLATRTTYNADGQVTVTEGGTVTGLDDTAWVAFTVDTKATTSYDAFGRVKTQAQVAKTGGTQYSITQYSYDAAGRPECTAVRMNAPTIQTALPADACTPMTVGADGPDRISRTYYNTADQVTEAWGAVGTALAQKTAAASYNANGTLAWIEDAGQNRTSYTYDGHDRSFRVTYPSSSSPNTVNPSDYEQVTYDAAGNVLAHRTRRGETLTFTYDDLGRPLSKVVPERAGLAATHTRDVFFGYDLYGALTHARFDSQSGEGLSFAYNGLGQLTSATQNLDGTARQLSYLYDLAGQRTRITHPDGAWWAYDYDTLGRFRTLKDQANRTLVNTVFNSFGPLSRIVKESSAPDDFFYYDAARRLNRIFLNHPVNSWDVNRQWTFNPANQAVTEALDNALYPWTGHPASTSQVTYTADGLNRITQANANTFSYDANGNLTSDSLTSYVYDVENRLVGASGQNTAALRYDPFGRLHEVIDWQGSVRRFLYDGDALVGEYGPTGTMLARHVHGVGAGDDPLITYPGASVSYLDAEYLYTDRLGSVIARFKRDGSATAINGYDEYGVPGPSTGVNNNGRFRYTGQVWLPELGLYYYKARMYSPTIGRFMQTDPIGYADGMNMYAYVGNDPVNLVDPTGEIAQGCSLRIASYTIFVDDLDRDGQGDATEPFLFMRPNYVPECPAASDTSGLTASGRGGGGRGSGGGGASGSWVGDDDEVDENGVPVIVVRAMKANILVAMPQFHVVFDYPRSDGHSIRHLIDYGMSPQQINSLKRKITGHVQINFNGPRRYSIEFEGQTYMYGAFEVSPGVINVGSIYRL